MKNYKKLIPALLTVAGFLTVLSCKQEMIDLQPPPVDTATEHGTSGSASFAKFVAVGSSYTAGFQAGALFNEGQANSLPAILNKQFALAGGTSTFNQPDINTVMGYNIFITPNPDANNHVLGRFLLQYNGQVDPLPTPQLSGIEALPNPSINPSFIYSDGSKKATLNNFGIQAIVIGQSFITQTGNWAGAGVDPRFNPFYGRLAYPGTGSATLIGDVAAAGGSFFMFWLGMDDFLLYAAYGGDPTKAPLTNAIGGTPTDFDFQYTAAITTLLGSNSSLKGVVCNFPDIFKMPHFTSIPYNAIVFTADDQATKIDPTNAAYAPYNGGLDAAFGGGAITAAERDKRKIHFGVGANGIVIEDETLTNLSGLGLPSIRQATASDVFPLSAGSVLGTEATPGNPATTWGVGKALTDQYALLPSELDEINSARLAYNQIVAGVQNANSDKLALADIDAALETLIANQVGAMNGVFITPNIDPPTGIYSEDGIHPNSRGYAFLSTVIIQAINDKFGATVPMTNVAKYGPTGLPIP